MTEHRLRPAGERQRCGLYRNPVDGSLNWGDHRVTLPGTTCQQTQCTVKHHPDILPGWAEPYDDPDFVNRLGVRPIAAAFDGWDAAGMHTTAMGATTAFIAAHIAMDALRDAGYTITAPTDGPFATAADNHPHTDPAPAEPSEPELLDSSARPDTAPALRQHTPHRNHPAGP